MSAADAPAYTEAFLKEVTWANITYPRMHPPEVVAGAAAILDDMQAGRTTLDDFIAARPSQAQLTQFAEDTIGAHRAFGIPIEYKPNEATLELSLASPDLNDAKLERVLLCTQDRILWGIEMFARSFLPDSVIDSPFTYDASRELFGGTHTEAVKAITLVASAGALALHAADARGVGKVVRTDARNTDHALYHESAVYRASLPQAVRPSRTQLATLVGNAMLARAKDLPAFVGQYASLRLLVDGFCYTEFSTADNA